MVKSISKKIQIFMLAVIIGLCVSLTFGGVKTFASEEPTDVEGYKQAITEIVGEIGDISGNGYSVQDYFDHIDSYGTDGEKLAYIKNVYDVFSYVQSAHKDYEDKTATLSKEFVYEYYKNKAMVDSLGYLKSFKLEPTYQLDLVTEKAKVDGKANEFETNAKEQEDELLELIEKKYITAKLYFDYYASAKFDEGKDALQGGYDGIETSIKTYADDTSEGNNHTKIVANVTEVFSNYCLSFNGTKTHIDKENAKINELYIQNSGNVLEGATRCQDALTYFKNLGTITVKKEDGTDGTIDLKTGVSDSDKKSWDPTYAEQILVSYKRLLKQAVDDIKSEKADLYGISAEKTISDNVNLTKKLIDKLNISGELDNKYGNVENGLDILDAFEESYDIDATIKVDGDKSKAVSKYKKVSSISFYENEKNKSKSKYVITLTAKDWANEDVLVFDALAYLSVREGSTPSVERNINKIINTSLLDTHLANGITKSDADNVKNKKLMYYFTLLVYEPSQSNLTSKEISSKDKFKVVELEEDYKIHYEVSVKFGDELKEDEFGSYVAMEYYHTTINSINEINLKKEEKVMGFTVNDVAKMQFAVAGEGDWKNIAELIVLGLIGLVVLLFVVWLIVHAVRSRKYIIYFKARGGKYSHTVTLRRGEPFSYPADPEKKGYVFLGWYIDKACKTKFATSILAAKRKITVYAKWITEAEYLRLVEEQKALAEQNAPKAVSFEDLEKAKAEAVAEAEANIKKQLEEEAQRKAEEEKRIKEAVDARVKELEAQKKPIINDEILQKLAELLAGLRTTTVAPVVVTAPTTVEKPAEEPTEFDVVKAFDELKGEAVGYVKADTLDYELERGELVRLKVVNDTIEVEAELDLADAKSMGYDVVRGNALTSKLEVKCSCGVKEAEELIEDVMSANGFKKVQGVQFNPSTVKEREDGVGFGASSLRAPETIEEMFNIVRVYAKSFVSVDKVEKDIQLVKAFIARGKLFVYMNYNDGSLKTSNEEMDKIGLQAFMTVKDVDDLKKAVKAIGNMMKANGLVRIPENGTLDDGNADGYDYVLKA